MPLEQHRELGTVNSEVLFGEGKTRLGGTGVLGVCEDASTSVKDV